MSLTVLSQLRNLLKLFSLSTSDVELEMRFQLHLKSPRVIRLLWKLESMALEKWSCLRLASQENGFLWKGTHLSTSSSSLKWVLSAFFLLVFSSKSLSIRLWFFYFLFSLFLPIPAYNNVNNCDDTLFSDWNAQELSIRGRSLFGCFVLLLGFDDVYRYAGDFHDHRKPSCVLQAKGPPILSFMGIFSSLMDP